MKDIDRPERKKHQHKGKTSEGRINSKAVLETLNIKPGQTILDAGCGNGYMSKLFSAMVLQSGKVYALDPDSNAIEILKKESQRTNIEAIEGDITQTTPIKPSSVDLIYIAMVIHGFSEAQMQGFLTEASRLLKPGGRLAVVEIEKKETSFGPPMELRFSPEELKKIVPFASHNTTKAGEYLYMQIFKCN